MLDITFTSEVYSLIEELRKQIIEDYDLAEGKELNERESLEEIVRKLKRTLQHFAKSRNTKPNGSLYILMAEFQSIAREDPFKIPALPIKGSLVTWVTKMIALTEKEILIKTAQRQILLSIFSHEKDNGKWMDILFSEETHPHLELVNSAGTIYLSQSRKSVIIRGSIAIEAMHRLSLDDWHSEQLIFPYDRNGELCSVEYTLPESTLLRAQRVAKEDIVKSRHEVSLGKYYPRTELKDSHSLSMASISPKH